MDGSAGAEGSASVAGGDAGEGAIHVEGAAASVGGSASFTLTSDSINLGNGARLEFLGGARDVIYEGSGDSTISGGVQEAADNGLPGALRDVSLAADVADVQSFAFMTVTPDSSQGWADVTVAAPDAGAMLNVGTVSLAEMASGGLVLPTS